MELLLVDFKGGTDRDPIGVELARWFEYKTKSKIDVHEYSCIGVYKRGVLSGAIIYTNYTGYNFDIHVYLPKSLIRSVIREMFDYPFNRAGVLRLTARMHPNNNIVINILIKLGFKEEIKLSNYYGVGIDQLIYTATRENIEKWIR